MNENINIVGIIALTLMIWYICNVPPFKHKQQHEAKKYTAAIICGLELSSAIAFHSPFYIFNSIVWFMITLSYLYI